MNKGQVTSAVGMVLESIRLMKLANDMLEQNEIYLCSINPNTYDNEVQVYSGIDKLAEVYEAGLILETNSPNRDKYIKIGKAKFFEIAQDDGTYL